MFATVVIGGFDVQNGKLAYINCGNEPPRVIRNGCVLTTLKPTAPVVGLFPGISFKVHELVLDKEDLLLAYTDGIPDARNPNDDSFTNRRLIGMLPDAGADPSLMLEYIQKQLSCFMGDAHQFDDITIMAVKRNV